MFTTTAATSTGQEGKTEDPFSGHTEELIARCAHRLAERVHAVCTPTGNTSSTTSRIAETQQNDDGSELKAEIKPSTSTQERQSTNDRQSAPGRRQMIVKRLLVPVVRIRKQNPASVSTADAGAAPSGNVSTRISIHKLRRRSSEERERPKPKLIRSEVVDVDHSASNKSLASASRQEPSGPLLAAPTSADQPRMPRDFLDVEFGDDAPLVRQVHSVLPVSFRWKVKSIEHLAGDQIPPGSFRAVVVTDVTQQTWEAWMAEFCENSASQWTLRSVPSKAKEYKHVECNRAYLCHRSNQFRGQHKTKKTDCRAQLKVQVWLTESRRRRIDSDFMAGLRGTVKIDFSHNHSLEGDNTLGAWKPDNEIRAIYEDYFRNFIRPPEAKQFYEEQLEQELGGWDQSFLENPRKNPPLRQVYYWFGEFIKRNPHYRPNRRRRGELQRLKDLGVKATRNPSETVRFRIPKRRGSRNPIYGIWPKGVLEEDTFHDFVGSTMDDSAVPPLLDCQYEEVVFDQHADDPISAIPVVNFPSKIVDLGVVGSAQQLEDDDRLISKSADIPSTSSSDARGVTANQSHDSATLTIVDDLAAVRFDWSLPHFPVRNTRHAPRACVAHPTASPNGKKVAVSTLYMCKTCEQPLCPDCMDAWHSGYMRHELERFAAHAQQHEQQQQLRYSSSGT